MELRVKQFREQFDMRRLRCVGESWLKSSCDDLFGTVEDTQSIAEIPYFWTRFLFSASYFLKGAFFSGNTNWNFFFSSILLSGKGIASCNSISLKYPHPKSQQTPRVSTELEMVVNLSYSFILLQKISQKGACATKCPSAGINHNILSLKHNHKWGNATVLNQSHSIRKS